MQQKFVQMISLGMNCSVAASMRKYGFRSFSGPFDWVVSPFIEKSKYGGGNTCS